MGPTELVHKLKELGTYDIFHDRRSFIAGALSGAVMGGILIGETVRQYDGRQIRRMERGRTISPDIFMAPEFSVMGLDGRLLQSSDFRGKCRLCFIFLTRLTIFA